MRIYRCALEVEIPRGARHGLVDALAAAPVVLPAGLGRQEVEGAIRAGRLRVHYLLDTPWEDFEAFIGVVSRSVFALVRGLQVLEIQDEGGATLQVVAEKIVGRRGETVRLPLRPLLQPDGVHVDAEAEDLDGIRSRWRSYPLWAQDALRRKYPAARAW